MALRIFLGYSNANIEITGKGCYYCIWIANWQGVKSIQAITYTDVLWFTFQGKVKVHSSVKPCPNKKNRFICGRFDKKLTVVLLLVIKKKYSANF